MEISDKYVSQSKVSLSSYLIIAQADLTKINYAAVSIHPEGKVDKPASILLKCV